MLSSWHSEGNSRCELRQDLAPVKNLGPVAFDAWKNTMENTVQISLSTFSELACQSIASVNYEYLYLSIRKAWNITIGSTKDPTGRVEQHPCAYLSGWWLNKSKWPTIAFIDCSAPVQDLHAQWPCLTCPHPMFSECFGFWLSNCCGSKLCWSKTKHSMSAMSSIKSSTNHKAMPKHQKTPQIFGLGKSVIVKPECGASCEHSLASTPIPGDRPPLQWDRDDPVSHVHHVDAGHVWLCDLPCFAEVLATACSLLPEFAKVAPSLFQTLTSAALICFERNVWSIEAAAVWSFGRSRHALARAFPRTPLMNAQWSPPVWINLFVKLCPTLSQNVLTQLRFMNWRTILPTKKTGLLHPTWKTTSNIRLNRRIEISSGSKWSSGALGISLVDPREMLKHIETCGCFRK